MHTLVLRDIQLLESAVLGSGLAFGIPSGIARNGYEASLPGRPKRAFLGGFWPLLEGQKDHFWLEIGPFWPSKRAKMGPFWAPNEGNLVPNGLPGDLLGLLEAGPSGAA